MGPRTPQVDKAGGPPCRTCRVEVNRVNRRRRQGQTTGPRLMFAQLADEIGWRLPPARFLSDAPKNG